MLQADSAQIRLSAVAAYAQRLDDTSAKLLYDDYVTPIDPQRPITHRQVKKAARTQNLTAEEVRARYEAMASDLFLKLGWKL